MWEGLLMMCVDAQKRLLLTIPGTWGMNAVKFDLDTVGLSDPSSHVSQWTPCCGSSLGSSLTSASWSRGPPAECRFHADEEEPLWKVL